MSNSAFTIISTLIFVVALGTTSFRIYQWHYPGPNLIENRKFGFCDFYNGIYYPTQAFINGDNPYEEDIVDKYAISRQVPFYSPLIFLMHIPFALLPKAISAFAYFALLIALVLAIARLTLYVLGVENRIAWLMLVAGCLLVTRPGHNSIFNGYFTLELALGTLLALHYGKSRPWLATLGLIVASCKPTYALPLFILMVCRGHWRPAIVGAVISSVVAFAGLVWVADNQSPAEIYGFVSAAQHAHHDFPNVWPVNTWTRIDLLAVIAKWNSWRPSDNIHLAAMFGILIIPCAVIVLNARRRKVSEPIDQQAGGLIGLICMLAMLVSIYHHFYDGIILVVPIVGLLLAQRTSWSSVGRIHRYALLGLLLIPFVNYLSSRAVINLLDLDGSWFTIVTSMNGICLTIALFYACSLELARLREYPTSSVIDNEIT